MDRRAFIAGAIAFSVAPLAVEAQPAGKVWRIGMLWFGNPEDLGVRMRFDAFRQGLREQGYMEGRNVAFEHRSAGGSSSCSPTSPPSWSV